MSIKALPGMTARCREGEYRITLTDDAIRALFPNATYNEVREYAENMACYTNDAEDALGTARHMSNNR